MPSSAWRWTDGVDGEVSALLLVPQVRYSRSLAPAILWLHSSTPDKTQIIVPTQTAARSPWERCSSGQGCVVSARTPTGTRETAPARAPPAGRKQGRRTRRACSSSTSGSGGRSGNVPARRPGRPGLPGRASGSRQAHIGTTGMSMGSTARLVAGGGRRPGRRGRRRRLPDALPEPHPPRPAATARRLLLGERPATPLRHRGSAFLG